MAAENSGIDDLEFATLTYVDWFNHQRLHGEITTDASYTTPAEFEAVYYSQNQPAAEAVTQYPRAVTKLGAVHPVVFAHVGSSHSCLSRLPLVPAELHRKLALEHGSLDRVSRTTATVGSVQ